MIRNGGIVDIIGQGRGENHVVLQDPRKPNPYFIYDPIQKNTTEPWGAMSVFTWYRSRDHGI